MNCQYSWHGFKITTRLFLEPSKQSSGHLTDLVLHLDLIMSFLICSWMGVFTLELLSQCLFTKRLNNATGLHRLRPVMDPKSFFLLHVLLQSFWWPQSLAPEICKYLHDAFYQSVPPLNLSATIWLAQSQENSAIVDIIGLLISLRAYIKLQSSTVFQFKAFDTFTVQSILLWASRRGASGPESAILYKKKLYFLQLVARGSRRSFTGY